MLSNMHRSILLPLLLLTQLPQPISSYRFINITCKYFKEFRTHIGEVHVCFVISNHQILYDETYISTVGDANRTLEKDFKTKHFATLDKNYKFMPQGLSNIFENLQGLEFVHSKLQVLRLKDMRPHLHLEYLNLKGNDIECIDGDVFTYNFKLKFISLADNKIRRVDVKIFQNLIHIREFYMNGNFCINFKAKTFYEIEDLKRKLSRNCAPLYTKNGHPMKCEQLVELEMENSRNLDHKLKIQQERTLELEAKLREQEMVNEILKIKVISSGENEV